MSASGKLTPTGSQTVGPYFHIGLQRLVEDAPAPNALEAITIQGRVLDRDGAPVSDAMLEFWSPGQDEFAGRNGIAAGFGRAATDIDGGFRVSFDRSPSSALGDGLRQAPHMLVLVFARGLLRHLITRVYFEGHPDNSIDPVLGSVPPGRRHTLVARRQGENSYSWDVILQGVEETVFFAW